MTFTAAPSTARTRKRVEKVGSDGLTDTERAALGARYSRDHELTDADRIAFEAFLQRKRVA